MARWGDDYDLPPQGRLSDTPRAAHPDLTWLTGDKNAAADATDSNDVVIALPDRDPNAPPYRETLRQLIEAADQNLTAGGSGWVRRSALGGTHEDRREPRLHGLVLDRLAETQRTAHAAARRLWRPTEAGRAALHRWQTEPAPSRLYSVDILQRQGSRFSYDNRTRYYGRLLSEGVEIERTAGHAGLDTARTAVRKLRARYEDYFRLNQRRYELDKERVESEQRQSRVDRAQRRNAFRAAGPALWTALLSLIEGPADDGARETARNLVETHRLAVAEIQLDNDSGEDREGTEGVR
jgi:DNA-binding PadR family transcriptional regulator